ncbi:MAG: DUF4366 domain-containing protein [Eubacteriales bacterium]|nr:DUF4366 domain-containing protein [Eubacteriales bacterium]
MNKRTSQFITLMMVALLILAIVPAAAYADGGESQTLNPLPAITEPAADHDPTLDPQAPTDSSAPTALPVPIEVAVPLTPGGNLTLVDDVEDKASEDKQFITVISKSGNTFYLIIDRAADKNNVYFLNLVDEADLLALIEDDGAKSQATSGAVSVPEPTPQPTAAPETAVENPAPVSSKTRPILPLFLFLLVAAGGGFAYFKLRQPKPTTKGLTNLDEYTFDDEEDELEEIVEPVPAIKSAEADEE